MMRLIDADALIKSLKLEEGFYRVRTWNFDGSVYSSVYRSIKSEPTIEAEPVRHGEWIPQDNTRTKFMCSVCEGKNYGGYENYCPRCGAKMDGGKEK